MRSALGCCTGRWRCFTTSSRARLSRSDTAPTCTVSSDSRSSSCCGPVVENGWLAPACRCRRMWRRENRKETRASRQCALRQHRASLQNIGQAAYAVATGPCERRAWARRVLAGQQLSPRCIRAVAPTLPPQMHPVIVDHERVAWLPALPSRSVLCSDCSTARTT